MFITFKQRIFGIEKTITYETEEIDFDDSDSTVIFNAKHDGMAHYVRIANIIRLSDKNPNHDRATA
jgi:hypothetical protein